MDRVEPGTAEAYGAELYALRAGLANMHWQEYLSAGNVKVDSGFGERF